MSRAQPVRKKTTLKSFGIDIEKLSVNKCCGGEFHKYRYKSPALGDTFTQFNVFIPATRDGSPAPVLYYLAGLTCTEDTGAWKGGFFSEAAGKELALVFPDTSPRGAGVEGEEKDSDFGTGAGFYINASKPQYAKHYNMYKFIVEELPAAINSLGINLHPTLRSIFGHSMGGHGALTIYLKNLDKYTSASAFAAIFNPSNPECAWGKKAFEGYLNNGQEEGKEWDATEIIRGFKEDKETRPDYVKPKLKILADYGDADQFYKANQLLPLNFIAASRQAGYNDAQVKVTNQPGYDHSYFFITSFALPHIHFHAAALKEARKLLEQE